MASLFSPTGIVFLITIVATFLVTFIARNHSKNIDEDGLASHNLNRWLVGLSAGATANSGFIVTAGVGLGYMYGVQWILLPIAWFIGDVIFWKFFPARINKYGREIKAVTVTDLVTGGFDGKISKTLAAVVGVLIIVCLTGYTSAQWLAGQKFVAGAFGLDPMLSLSLFGLVIIAYTTIGGFRGSIYVDSMQAVIRIIGTVVALIAVVYVARQNSELFWEHIAGAGDGFLSLFTMGSIPAIIGFVVGFAAASLGFGLGQPQIITRYLSGASPDETQKAQWIYIGFVQFTWISMTLFGVILRGVMPDIQDPEAGLSVFITSHFGFIIAGLIVADIFATIAATSNSLLISMAQSMKNDLLPVLSQKLARAPLALVTLSLGIVSMIVSVNIGGTVLSLALSSVSYLGAGLAPVVMIKVLDFKSSALSVLLSIAAGLIVAYMWKSFGYSSLVNEAAPGMIFGLLVNWVTVKLLR